MKYIVNCNNDYLFSVEEGKEQEGIERAQRETRNYLGNFKRYKHLYPPEEYTDKVKRYKKVLSGGFEAVTWDTYMARERERLLSIPLKEITEEEYNEKLNVLLPLYWTRVRGVEVFCMREMINFSYTDQYAHVDGGKYYTKVVDVNDRSTWIPEILCRNKEAAG